MHDHHLSKSDTFTVFLLARRLVELGVAWRWDACLTREKQEEFLIKPNPRLEVIIQKQLQSQKEGK